MHVVTSLPGKLFPWLAKVTFPVPVDPSFALQFTWLTLVLVSSPFLVHASVQQNVSLPQVTYHQLQEASVLVCFSIDLNTRASINLPVPSNRRHTTDYSVHRKSAWLLLMRADQVRLPNSQSLADCLSSAEHQHSALLYDRQGVIPLLFGRKRSCKFGSELKMDTLRRNKVTTILQCKQWLNIFCAWFSSGVWVLNSLDPRTVCDTKAVICWQISVNSTTIEQLWFHFHCSYLCMF